MPTPSSNPEPAKQSSGNPESGLRHQLTAGQMTMVAVGGSIGTGLLLGTAAAIELAGPAVILSFVLAAFISWTVALALGELASTHPAAGSFGVYGDLYLNHWAGFISRAGYWLAIAVSIGAEMVASATYMRLWFPRVPASLWVFVFSAFLLAINFLAVHTYGRFEFWFAMIKVAIIATFIALGAALLLTGRAAPQYSAHGGFFPLGPAAPLLAITFAIYTFGGVEFVAVASGESSSAKAIASAVRMTFLTLTFLYLGAISRMLFSLARTGWAPQALGRLSAKGTPTLALLASSYGIVVALILERWAPAKAFEYILRGAFFGMMLSWIISLAAHINFRRRLTAAESAEIPARSPLGKWGSIIGLAVVVASIAKTWWDSRINLIAGLTFLIALTVLYFLLRPIAKQSNV